MLKAFYKHIKIIIYALLVIHWISIFILTSLPSKSLPHFALHDKLKHFIAYLILSILLTLSLWLQEKFLRFKREFVKFSFFITIIYATFDEIHQIFIPGRDAELFDWLANLLGIILGIYIAKLLINKYDSSKFREPGTVYK